MNNKKQNFTDKTTVKFEGINKLDVFPELVLQADNVCLRPIPWNDLELYGTLIADGLFTEGEQNTVGYYYDAQDTVSSARKLVSQQISFWSDITPESWKLDFGIYVDDELVGRQLVGAENFLLSKVVYSDSFVIPAWRNRGVGKKARAAMLALVFDVLGARAAMSTAMIVNEASEHVSRALGYIDNGFSCSVVGDKTFDDRNYILWEDIWKLKKGQWQLSTVGVGGLLEKVGISAHSVVEPMVDNSEVGQVDNVDMKKIAETVVVVNGMLDGVYNETGKQLWWKRPLKQLNGDSPEKVVATNPYFVIKLAQETMQQ